MFFHLYNFRFDTFAANQTYSLLNTHRTNHSAIYPLHWIIINPDEPWRFLVQLAPDLWPMTPLAVRRSNHGVRYGSADWMHGYHRIPDDLRRSLDHYAHDRVDGVVLEGHGGGQCANQLARHAIVGIAPWPT